VSAARAVETIACDARHAGKRVFISGMSDQVRKVLTGLNADHCVPSDAYFATRVDALRAAVGYCGLLGQGQPDRATSPTKTFPCVSIPIAFR
jgi:SulP family sulfate permease